MTYKSIVGGKLVVTAKEGIDHYAKEDIVINSNKSINLKGEENGVTYGKPESPPKKKQYLKKGWWSLDSEGSKKIKRAIIGMTVYFHLQTENIPNGMPVFMTLFDEDNFKNENDGSGFNKKDKDDKITLNKGGKEIVFEKVNNNKIVSKITLTKTLQNLANKEDDRLIELYFRCSYGGDNASFPSDKKEYLQVGQLVVDRYKMPGLNLEGTDIADDMTYGKGIKNPGTIYAGTTALSKYKEDYKKHGFDITKHNLFSNKSNLETTNLKAIYSKDDCYSTFYQAEVKVPFTNLKFKLPAISTGLDTRVFDNFSDDFLFWDFQETASLYFAKGKLEGNLKRMIAKFKRNEGGIYEDSDLTSAIINSQVTKDYCKLIEQYLSKKIKESIVDLNKVEDKTIYFGDATKIERDRKIKNKNFSRPIYNINKTEGLTIALNDIWATEVNILELKNENNKYSCKYEVILWDHFGLDKPDMEKVFNIIPSVGETFVCWFILQHLRGYKPFLTKIKFEKTFAGNL